MPAWGAAGGFLALGVCALAGLPASMIGPGRLADLNRGGATAGSPTFPGWPPFRGWIALLSTLIFGAVGAYIQPLARQAGLDADVALWLGAGLILEGLATVTWLQVTNRPSITAV